MLIISIHQQNFVILRHAWEWSITRNHENSFQLQNYTEHDSQVYEWERRWKKDFKEATSRYWCRTHRLHGRRACWESAQSFWLRVLEVMQTTDLMTGQLVHVVMILKLRVRGNSVKTQKPKQKISDWRLIERSSPRTLNDRDQGLSRFCSTYLYICCILPSDVWDKWTDNSLCPNLHISLGWKNDFAI